jgi:hypothetical protein
MRTLLAIAAFFALATGAEAYCYSVPDTAETHYSENNLARTLCLQDELVQSTNDTTRQRMLDLQISKMQRDLLQQRLLLQQLQNEIALDHFY